MANERERGGGRGEARSEERNCKKKRAEDSRERCRNAT